MPCAHGRLTPAAASLPPLAVSEDLQLTTQETVKSPIFTGEEEVFAFQRCVSRLSEMGGTKWAAFQEVADR